MGLMGRNKTAQGESPVVEKQPGPVDHMLNDDDTYDLVTNTDPVLVKQHFLARGRAETPFYVVSQVQSCNMSPLGLLGFGLTTALLQGATTTITEANTESVTYCFAIAYGGVAQLLAGLYEAHRGKIFGAVVFSSYGAFWLGFGLFGILGTVRDMPLGGNFSSGVLPGAATIPSGFQMLLCLWGILTFAFFICSLALNLALQLLLLLLTVTFFLLAKGQKSSGVLEVGGWFGIATAAVAIYMGFAELFNETAQRNVFPLGPMNWIAKIAPKRTYQGRPPAPYDVNRTEARPFGNIQRGNSYGDVTRAANGPGRGAPVTDERSHATVRPAPFASMQGSCIPCLFCFKNIAGSDNHLRLENMSFK